MLYEPIAYVRDAKGALEGSKVKRVPPAMQGKIIKFTPSSSEGVLHLRSDVQTVLEGKDYPVLVQIWDNDSDAIFDNL